MLDMAAPESPATQEALKLLGGFVKFVRERDEGLANRLLGLALTWSSREGIGMKDLMAAMSASDKELG